MMDIFNWFGNILGYLLWGLFTVFRNYGLAIVIFTLVLKVVLFPFSIKQQKSMAASSKLQVKVKELQKKYATDKVKLSEETQKLYQKEGVSPTGGCLPMLLPFPIMLGIYYSVMNPLQNVLHLAKEPIAKATEMLTRVPGIGGQFSTVNTYGMELQILKHFDDLRPHFEGFFNATEMGQISDLSKGFNFLGIDLLSTPGQSSFSSMVWLIPALVFITAIVSQYFMMKMQPGMNQQQGCMKWMMYLMPLMSVWFAWTMPAAVGFYYIWQTVFGFGQTIVMNVFYSPAELTSYSEAQRVVRRTLEEEKTLPLSPADQEILRAKLLPAPKAQLPAKKEQDPNQAAQKPAKPKGKAGGGKTTNNYMGTKK